MCPELLVPEAAAMAVWVDGQERSSPIAGNCWASQTPAPVPALPLLPLHISVVFRTSGSVHTRGTANPASPSGGIPSDPAFWHKELRHLAAGQLSLDTPGAQTRVASSNANTHTTESRISEPRRTRGRGQTGDTSTKLSWMLSGRFSDSVKTRGPGELSDKAW